MEYITTTDLRTKSSQLIQSLKNGTKVSLIHRSKVVGIIEPKKEPKVLTHAGIEKLKKLAHQLNLPKTTYKQREKIYREHLMKKYGKGIS
ncbi:MAG: hypothetical protein AAB512_05240 [Patescibacteria group bacterium]